MLKLTEGLRENDLQELVLPLLTIDEYDSKVDDDAIVIGFYVQDLEPANDLNRFIQKSSVVLLDTEVSPAPDENGYFLVFVEFTRDDDVKMKINMIVEEIQNLVGIDPSEWTFTCYGHDKIFELNEKNLQVLIRTKPIEVLKQEVFLEELHEFFQPSILDSVSLIENVLTLRRRSERIGGAIEWFGPVEDLSESYFSNSILSEEANRSCRIWEGVLGQGWQVNIQNPYVFITNTDSANVLVLTV